MIKIRCLAYSFLLPLVALHAASALEIQDLKQSGKDKQQPNIIVFMADDLGWNHIGVESATMGTANNAYHTPHIDALAESGLSFTHAYTQPNCAPTRAAMLSGQYPARVNNSVYVVGNLNRFGRGGITKAEAKFRGPEQKQYIAAASITVAEALKKNGYATAHIGKYHVGGHNGDSTMPRNAGFDINVGGFSQGNQRTCFASQKNGNWKFKSTGRGDFDRYALPYTKAYVEKRKLPASLVGTPKHICDALGDAMEDTVKELALGDQPFYLQFHSYAVHAPVQARPDLKQAAAERLGAKNILRPGYLGFVSGVDENMGRIMAALDDPNGDGDQSYSIAGNTLVLFTSDNGGVHAKNEPLRGEKGMFTEGGIRVPLIARWPGVIPAGTVTDHKIHTVDYYPTYLDVAGNKWLPAQSEHPLDGESFADILRKPAAKRTRQPVFYLFPGYMDIRAEPCVVAIDDVEDKRYKLLYFYEADSWKLYCLTDDQGEKNDIVATRGDVASEISHKMDAWLNQTHPTWQPKFPIDKKTGKPVAPPPVLKKPNVSKSHPDTVSELQGMVVKAKIPLL